MSPGDPGSRGPGFSYEKERKSDEYNEERRVNAGRLVLISRPKGTSRRPDKKGRVLGPLRGLLGEDERETGVIKKGGGRQDAQKR